MELTVCFRRYVSEGWRRSDAFCPLLVAAPPVHSGGHGGEAGDEIGLQILFGLVRKHNLHTPALQLQQRDNAVEPKARQPILVFNPAQAGVPLPCLYISLICTILTNCDSVGFYA